MIDEENNKFICVIPSKKEYRLLGELNKIVLLKLLIKKQ